MPERRFWRRLDVGLILLTVALLAYGVVVLASATRFDLVHLLEWRRWTAWSNWSFVQRQIVWILLGLGGMVFCLTFDYRSLMRWANHLYGLSLILLTAVLYLGEGDGSNRWLSFGPFQLQPSEFSKLIFIISLAAFLARKDKGIHPWLDPLLSLAYLAPPLFLIVRQPDLGTALVLLGILVGVLFMAGMPLLHFSIFCLSGLVAGVGAIVSRILFDAPIPLQDYQLNRLIIFLNPAADPFGDGYQILQSQYAIGSGRLYGEGLFRGEQIGLQYIPERHTDFIFSVVGEELGFLGSVVMLLLMLLILWKIFHIAGRAKDPFGSLLAAGVGSMYGFHTLVNVGMTVGLMPVTGLPLSFVSYGGSAMLINLTALGLVLNVSMRRRRLHFDW